MTGAEILLKTAVKAGVEICFTNPGTTELPLVSAFDTVPGIRPILGLFEGCCTGAADGYGRMTDKPAMTLLHLGPGLGNGIANLHNARRARTPILNVIGEHATWHRSADSPLSMDIVALAESLSGWQRTSTAPQHLSQDTTDAVTAALSGKVATLIVPSDVQWSESPDDKIYPPKAFDGFVEKESIERAVALLRTEQKAALILGGVALHPRGLAAAARIKVKICSNRSYNILNIEFSRSGIISPGRYAQTLTDLSNPAIDWVRLSQGMGVPAVAVDSCESLARELKIALDEPGPHLIEMVF